MPYDTVLAIFERYSFDLHVHVVEYIKLVQAKYISQCRAPRHHLARGTFISFTINLVYQGRVEGVVEEVDINVGQPHVIWYCTDQRSYLGHTLQIHAEIPL